MRFTCREPGTDSFVDLIAPTVTAQDGGPGTGGMAHIEQERRYLQTDRRVLLIAAHPDDEDTELLTIQTQGDIILDTALSKIGDKGLFTREIENALLTRRIDLAVEADQQVGPGPWLEGKGGTSGRCGLNNNQR